MTDNMVYLYILWLNYKECCLCVAIAAITANMMLREKIIPMIASIRRKINGRRNQRKTEKIQTK